MKTYYRRYCGCLCEKREIPARLIVVKGCGKSWGNSKFIHAKGDLFFKNETEFKKIKFRDLKEEEIIALVINKIE